MKASQRTAELRYAAWARKVAAEEPLERIVLAGMDLWAAALLDAITDPRLAGLESAASARTTWETFLRFGLEPKIGALFRGAFDATVPPALTAAAGDEDFDELLAQELEKLDPAEFQRTVDGQFGEEFNATRKSADHSGYRYEQQHIETVHDRLVIWPDDAWEELRPNIEEAMADAADLEEVKAKIARELGIDAETRRLRAEIAEIDKRLDTEQDMPGPEWDALQAWKRQLWRQHDESFGDWEWKARRIARTEVQGAVEGGQHAAAEHAQAVTGQVWYRRWLSTPDDRTRMSHRVADGQVVGPGEKFRVGAAELQYPGDPFANAPSETIQCRCTVLLWSAADLQAELQGSDGSMGAVRPGGVRRGPDDQAAVAAAIDLEQAEQDAWDAENGMTAAGRRGMNKGGDPLNRGRFSRWVDGVSGVEQPSAPDREGRRFGVGFPGKLPKDAPAGSEDWATAYRGARRLDLDAAPPAPYERRETATIDRLNAAHLISPADDPLRMALHPPNDAAPDVGAARAAAGLNLLNVRAVTVADLAGSRGSEFTGATADILVLPAGTFVEAKEQTGNARTVRRKLRRAREQARVVIGEAPNITVAEAEEIITGLVGDPAVSPHLDELRILAGDGAVYWRRGR